MNSCLSHRTIVTGQGGKDASNYLNFSNPEGIDAKVPRGRQITRGASLGFKVPPGTPGKEGEDSRAPVNRKHVS